MPDFFIAQKNESRESRVPEFARFENGKIGWTTLSRATPFSSAEQARESFDKVTSSMFDKARKGAAATKKSGALTKNGAGEFRLLDKISTNILALFLPPWCHSFDEGAASFFDSGGFRAVARTADRDLLQSIDFFYVRNDLKWLGGPTSQTAPAGPRKWVLHLDQAQPFASHADAMDARESHAHREDNCWIVKTTAKLESVTALIANPADAPEPFMETARGACEARRERLAIDAAIDANERKPDAPRRSL